MRETQTPLKGPLIWTTTLSVALCWAPLAGPFIAGFVGGRKARDARTAFVAGAVPAAIWAVALWFATSRQVAIGKDVFALAPFAPIAPATAMALLGGALAGATGRGARSLGVLLALVGVVMVGVRVNDIRATLAPFLQRPAGPPTSAGAAPTSCEANLKKLYGALTLYAGSWDDCLPPSGRWATALQESSGESREFRCPDAPAGIRGYAMNEALGGKKLGAIGHPADTPLIYDSNARGDNPADAVASLPSPGRHAGRNYVLYADGTVRPK